MLLAAAPDIPFVCRSVSGDLIVTIPGSLGKVFIDITQQAVEKLHHGKDLAPRSIASLQPPVDFLSVY